MRLVCQLVVLPAVTPRGRCGPASEREAEKQSLSAWLCACACECVCVCETRVLDEPLSRASAEDFPGGTWLGDDNNPEMRVRCPVSSADMLHISTNCRSAEKMALTLLDYLFHREVQAMSNLSGQGKHGKKQLDPLMIYGIRCESLSPSDAEADAWGLGGWRRAEARVEVRGWGGDS